MNGNSNSDDNLNCNDDDDVVVLPPKKGGRISCSTYSIEVCQGPDCTGLGGGISVLEIEELVQEHHNQNQDNGSSRIRVVAGGCRDFCSVGPNAHVLVRKKHQQQGKKRTTAMLESFQNVKDASSCDRVVHNAIAWASAASDGPAADGDHHDTDAINENPRASSSSSMMARKAERTRWEALKDVSRTIAKCKKVVVSNRDGGSGTTSNIIERKLRISKETCTDRIGRATTTMSKTNLRDQRRMKRLIDIASERLDRICLQRFDDESDSSSYSSSDDESDTSDE